VPVSAESVTCCSSLDCFNLLNCSGSVWIPNSLAVFKNWTYEGFIAVLFDLWIADVDVTAEKAKSGVSLGRDVVDMFIPVQIMGYLDTEILDNIYMLQLVAIQHIRTLCWVMLPGYAYYFTFVWVELRHLCFPQAANLSRSF